MDKVLGQDYQGAKRVQFLRDNCEKVEEKRYMKAFSSEDVSTMKDELSETAISIDDIETKKKEQNALLKEEMSPLKTSKTRLLKLIKNKAELVTEDCFKFVDFDTKAVGYYNGEGVLIEERTMRPDEGQRTINMTAKTGTHD